MLKRLLHTILLALALGVAPLSAEPPVATVTVTDATVRVPLPGKNLTSAYFLLHNTGEQARSLVSVSTEFAERAELHEHRTVDGMMRMRQVDAVEIPAGEKVRFASGGYHVMLFDLKRRPRTGDPLHLILTFDDGSEQAVKAYAVSVFDRPHHNH